MNNFLFSSLYNASTKFWYLFAGFAVFLFVMRIVLGQLKKDRKKSFLIQLEKRLNFFWVLAIFMIICFFLGKVAMMIFFAVASLFALREFLTLVPTSISDHYTLAVCYYVLIPLQYILVGLEAYEVYSIALPLLAFLFLPILSSLGGHYQDFMSRVAKIQWGVMLTVYCMSYIPALMSLHIVGYESQMFFLVIYLLLVSQIGDILQFVYSRLILNTRVRKFMLGTNKTIEGVMFGSTIGVLMGTGLWWLTPFSVFQSFLMSCVIIFFGVCGNVSMGAIKKSAKTKEWGSKMTGYGGTLDRLDSVIFAAPAFFMIVRWCWAI